jgi:nucleotide-binding universal stress UspA family protein
MAKPQQAVSGNLAPVAAPAPVLIGYDGSDGGRDALELGRMLSSIEGGRCIVAVPHDAELAEQARSAIGDPTAEVEEIGALLPAVMLVERAKRQHAATLVVGSTRRGRVGRVLLGSDVEQILRRTPCDVAIAPSDYASERHRGYTKIAMALDGTAGSKAVLTRAEALARDAGAALKTISARGQAVGGWWHAVGTTASAVVAACDAEVDLLVIGWRHRMDHFRAGSVTKHVITEVPCPVLVVFNGR